MTDEYVGPPSAYNETKRRLIAESETKAKLVKSTARTCVVCKKSMLNWPGRDRHYSCDAELPLAGARCTCTPGCSESHWGNGPQACDPKCRPCRAMAGKPLARKGR